MKPTAKLSNNRRITIEQLMKSTGLKYDAAIRRIQQFNLQHIDEDQLLKEKGKMGRGIINYNVSRKTKMKWFKSIEDYQEYYP